MIKNIKIFTTERLSIRETDETFLPDLQALWNNPEVMKWVNMPRGLEYDLDDISTWYSRMRKTDHLHHFVILDQSGVFTGELFYNCNFTSRTAGLDIKLRPGAWGSGYATEALSYLIEYIFNNEPDIDSVWTEPMDCNMAARRLYQKCGLDPVPHPDYENADNTLFKRFR